MVHACCSTSTTSSGTLANNRTINNDDGDNINRSVGLLGLDWEFNGYGGSNDGAYWPYDLDQHICQQTCQELSARLEIPIAIRSVPLILEGGSIHTDGQGTVLTTEECLLHPSRNPSKSKEEIESMILSAMGCTKMIWLPYGLAADDITNGHVDNMACFVSPTHVVLSWCDDDDQDLDNYQRCRAALQVLQQETDAMGRPLTIHKLHVPPPMYYTQEDLDAAAAEKDDDDDDNDDGFPTVGQRLAASYVNFYIANQAVIVPQFRGCDETNQRALKTLQQVFPTRTIVGVSSREILLGGGNIHCITQQVPQPW